MSGSLMTFAALAFVLPLQYSQIAASRTSTISSIVQAPIPEQEDMRKELTVWQSTKGGIKFVDERIGTGALPASDSVISLHYTVSFADSGMVIGTSQGRWPLSFAPEKHPVPIFADGVEGMRVGGRRRLSIPAHMIPESQVRNVPQDQAGEGLRIEVELVGIETGIKAVALSLLPPGNRRLVIARTVFLLSFLPYFLPEEIKPDGYKFGDLDAIVASHDAAANSLWLGGTAQPLDSLFQ
jgi:hypothetical protein